MTWPPVTQNDWFTLLFIAAAIVTIVWAAIVLIRWLFRRRRQESVSQTQHVGQGATLQGQNVTGPTAIGGQMRDVYQGPVTITHVHEPTPQEPRPIPDQTCEPIDPSAPLKLYLEKTNSEGFLNWLSANTAHLPQPFHGSWSRRRGSEYMDLHSDQKQIDFETTQIGPDKVQVSVTWQGDGTKALLVFLLREIEEAWPETKLTVERYSRALERLTEEPGGQEESESS